MYGLLAVGFGYASSTHVLALPMVVSSSGAALSAATIAITKHAANVPWRNGANSVDRYDIVLFVVLLAHVHLAGVTIAVGVFAAVASN